MCIAHLSLSEDRRTMFFIQPSIQQMEGEIALNKQHKESLYVYQNNPVA